MLRLVSLAIGHSSSLLGGISLALYIFRIGRHFIRKWLRRFAVCALIAAAAYIVAYMAPAMG